jgi:hypothetical protein
MSIPLPVAAIDKVEQVFDSFGMMRGAAAPVMRFGVGFLVGGLLVYAARPSFAFNKDGTARPWVPIAGGDKNATVTPWWTVGVALGGAFSILI